MGPFHSTYFYFLRYADFLKSNLREKNTQHKHAGVNVRCGKINIFAKQWNFQKSIHPPTCLSVYIYLISFPV